MGLLQGTVQQCHHFHSWKDLPGAHVPFSAVSYLGHLRCRTSILKTYSPWWQKSMHWVSDKIVKCMQIANIHTFNKFDFHLRELQPSTYMIAKIIVCLLFALTLHMCRYLDYNKIQSLSPGTFQGLTSLSLLWVNQNQIVTFFCNQILISFVCNWKPNCCLLSELCCP